ncbi:MAG: hypothetical protein KDD43_16260, partial [Bdellovibrionales bacterium]|nr:hypothetical protein [Bdellovibrionales bacterium]
MIKKLGYFAFLFGFLTLLDGHVKYALSQELERGKVLEVSSVSHYSLKALELSYKLIDSPQLPKPKNPVALYRVQYETIDQDGDRARASGLLILPDFPPPEGEERKLSLVSYQHGTVLKKSAVPSRVHFNPESLAGSLIYASQGYALLASDYLGLGDSVGFHPYLHAETEASAAYDFVIAALRVMTEMGWEKTGRLYLTGYSQGGHATMALGRYWQEHPIQSTETGLRIGGMVPMAGPYDLSGITLKMSQAMEGQETPAFTAYLVESMRRLYAPSLSREELFERAILKDLDGVWNGSLTIAEALERLPSKTSEILSSQILDALFNQDRE